MLDFTSLRHYKALVEAGSFSKAAKVLFVTQPAVSHQIRELERALGVQLLIRSRGALQLTLPGKYLYSFCQDLFVRLGEAERKIQDLKDTVQGTLRLGSPAGIYDGWFARVLADFARENPRVDYQIVIGSHEAMRHLLLERKIDAALLLEEATPDQGALQFIPVYQEEYILIASGRSDRCDISHIEEMVFIAFQESDHMLNRWLTVNVPDRLKLVHIRHTVNHVTGIVSFVKEDLGVAVLPRHAVEQELARGEVREITSPVGPARNLFYLAYRKHAYVPVGVRALTTWALARGNLKPAEAAPPRRKKGA